jgi:hypothetical protein
MIANPPNGYTRVSGSERHRVVGAQLTGPADPGEIFSVSLRLRRGSHAANLPDPSQLSLVPGQLRPLVSRDDFADHFGAAAADVELVKAFAAQHGLAVLEAGLARRTVVLQGTATQFGKAFAVHLDKYEGSAGKYRGREGYVHVPDALGAVVEGVFGLDNRSVLSPHYRSHEAGARPTAGAGGPTDSPLSPQGTTPLTPPQVAQLYGFPTSPTAAGQTIAILEFGGGFKSSDIQTWFHNLNLPMPSIAVVGVDGATNAPGAPADVEVVLDIDVAGAAAPGAKLAVYFAPNSTQGFVDAISTAVHDNVNKPSVISISWGGSEALNFSQSAINAVNASLQEAAAFGVTVFASSGDHGSDNQVGDHKAHVNYPASDPFVTGCGGTRISDVAGSNFTEHTWNDNDNVWLTGGGISTVFPPQTWQAWAGVPGSANDGKPGRGVPDIAGNADGASGYSLVINGAVTGAVGGTSATAPLYAGLAALLNASLGEPVGFLNPNLYALAGPYVFRDIADNVSNARGGAPGYVAGPGWDADTGLGVVNGTSLLNALRGVGLPPALATFNGKLWMVWKGIERDDRVFFSSLNGNTWAPQQQVPGIGSSTGTALAVFNGKLYMAWKGILSDQRIFFSSFDGVHWAPQQVIGGIATSTGPRLAVVGNALYMGWKGAEGDQRIFWSTFNGASWSPQQFIPGVASSVGPALVNFNNALHMVWKGWYGDQRLYASKLSGNTWAPQQALNAWSSEGPSLAVFQNALVAVWKGQFGDQTLWYSKYDGNTWAPQKQIAGIASSVGPGLAVNGNALFAAWKGMLGDQRLWFSHFDGNAWAPQQLIPGVGSSPDL